MDGDSDRIFAITRYQQGSEELRTERHLTIQDMLLYEDQYSQFSNTMSVNNSTEASYSSLVSLIKTENSN